MLPKIYIKYVEMDDNQFLALDMEVDPILPKGYFPLSTQVAGHRFLTGIYQSGMLVEESGRTVLKPYGKTPCGTRELAFYDSLQKTKDINILSLRELVPRFEGKKLLNFNGKELIFLKMENLTYNMSEPCVIDVKIGKRTWDPVANDKKRFTEEYKYASTKSSLGLCIPGLQVYCLNNGRFLRFGKEYGKRLEQSTFSEAILLFLNFKINPFVICPILRKLYTIRQWLQKNYYLKLFSSSILMAYDCRILRSLKEKKKCSESMDNSEDTEDWINIKMIDFAHVFDVGNDNVDTNYTIGLESLIHIFEEFLKKGQQKN